MINNGTGNMSGRGSPEVGGGAGAAIAGGVARGMTASLSPVAATETMQSGSSRNIEAPGAFRIFANNLIRSPSLMCFALAFLALPKSKFKSSITSTALNLSQPIVLSAAVGAAVFTWNKSLQDKYGQNLKGIGDAAIQPLKYLETLFSGGISNQSLKKMNSLALASFVIMAMSFKLSPLKFDANLSASYLLAGLLFACPPQELSANGASVMEEGDMTSEEVEQKLHDYKSFAVLMPVIVTNLLAVTISSFLIMKRGISSALSSFASSCNVKVSTAVLISSAMLASYCIGRVQGRRRNRW